MSRSPKARLMMRKIKRLMYIFNDIKNCKNSFILLRFFFACVSFVPLRQSGTARSKMRNLLQVEALFCYGNAFCLPPSHKFSTLDLFP